MKKIFIAIAILLVGCQTTNQPQHSVGSKQQAKKAQQGTNNSIYNRYKYSNNRYTQAKDGIPSANAKVNFKEPIPTREPISRYGNPSEYVVDGKNYQVLSSTKKYKARGMASWYGTKFHKQRTSSGEPYNMYVMSAAHKTLPLPTYVKITNLNNGKSAVVKVNDRGPFHSDRIIDVSYAAAVKLGIYPKGTAPVEVEALVGPASQGHYYVQAGAFSSLAMANQLKAKLQRIGASSIAIEQYQRHYIVRVGPFNSKNSADTLKQKLARNGLNGAFSVLI